MSDRNTEISPHEAADRTADTVLIDVREHDEWAAGHAPGAMHIPLGTLTEATVPLGVRVMCICRSGGRSGAATSQLRDAGIDAVNVTGGMTAWAAENLPVTRDDGTPGTVV